MRYIIMSTVVRKYLMAITGLALVAFVICHLLGNLTFYTSNGTATNTYAAFLESMGILLVIVEVGLFSVIGLHIITSLWITYENWTARPLKYKVSGNKGGSHNSIFSRNMIILGILLLVFLSIHVRQFQFGPGIKEGYMTQVHGEAVRDLYRLVIETFKKPLNVGFYVVCMFLLGFHLRHGFWSAFQSLGALNPKFSKLVNVFAIALAIVLAAGFLFIPIWIYFGGSA